MSAEEFSSRMLMKEGLNDTGCEEYDKHCDGLNTRKPRVFYNKHLPSKFDWRDHAGVVGPVLDQRGCLACWAFSVVGVMESKMVIQKSKYYHRLSVQELIDCSDLTNHCHGGNVAFAMKYLCRNMLPITWEERYPLTLEDENCRFKPTTGVLLESFTVHCNVLAMKIIDFIVNEGPVTAAVNAENWVHYLDGIIQYHCSSSPLRHVVQIVGYDFTTQPPHFIIKNSWGKDFGIEGYVKIAMGNFICGIGKQIGYLSVR
ncbi:cathepsin O-like [Hyposmocoma kahamanoa]|uniref:cathepsin O-like n=1 Tax=Hyposmocoma kahamanoa TaxID=1477025 RepID=UPI000E6D989A|nr:cathepsin O-like [Hyposmocoma kahamanoa]